MTTTSSEREAGSPHDGAVAPRVAVVIPCFRQAHFLGQAIESVLDQSRAADEVVVVDDGSPDNTAEVAANYPGVRCIRQDNAGLAGARNRGLGETASEFIVFLDADDRLLREALEIGVEALQSQEDGAFVWGFNCPIDAGGERIGDISNPFAGEATYARLLERNVVGPPAGVMFRRGPAVELPSAARVEFWNTFRKQKSAGRLAATLAFTLLPTLALILARRWWRRRLRRHAAGSLTPGSAPAQEPEQ